ncbi:MULTISPECIES: dienelactone hydrolase family protein [unclassified Psychrobacter]|nr:MULTISPECIES: dienelactone hydrolase family protein [unclassified Psychrobacter]
MNLLCTVQVYYATTGAPHAFSVFGSDRYDARADERSWKRYLDFLAEEYK